MREIKFRGKCVEKDDCADHDQFGKWLFGLPSYDLEDNIYYVNTSGADFYKVDPATIDQFTGLIDKNGKEIYENDILEFVTCGFNPERFITSVVWAYSAFRLANGRSFFYSGQKDLTRMSDAVVIGNMHDNPELVELKA